MSHEWRFYWNRRSKISVERGSFCLKLGLHNAKFNSLYRNRTIFYKSVAMRHIFYKFGIKGTGPTLHWKEIKSTNHNIRQNLFLS